MSTSEPARGGEAAGDQTQPTEDIINALAMINAVKAEPQSDLPPPTEYESLTAQLAENPHNPDGWRRLIAIVEEMGDIEKLCAAYDSLLKQYPNTAPAQIRYIDHFVHNEETFRKAEDLFQRFLKASPCVELWVYYLTYVRRTNIGSAQYDTVRKSYEFALNHVGQDKDSGEIWSDYIQFLKSAEANTTWEEQQKMDSLRKVYHRAVQIPLDNAERLWQELESFETNLNKITAKKFMADLTPAHMQARTVLRQLTNHLNPLYPPSHELYLPSLPRFDSSERTLVGKWKAYLKWEESNPLELEGSDRSTLIQRIQCVYRKAVIRMRYYTEIWFMAFTWLNSVGKPEEGLSMLKAGLEANPTSFLLTFTYAEALEVKKEYGEVHALYDKFLGILRQNLEAQEQSLAASNALSPAAGSNPLGPAASMPNFTNGNSNGIGNAGHSSSFTEGGTQSNNSSFNTQASDEKPSKSTELQKQRTEYGLAWIMYIRFARRAEGQKSQRAVFSKARRDRWTPWEVYEASALMEYHCSDEKSVASRIFEKGLDTFGDEIEYVIRYLGFLISVNDQNNARALFERVINNFSPERARPLWERWARYEYQYGDLEASLKLEKRMAEVYASDPPIKRLAQRHMYLGTDAIADRDLGFAIARKSQNPLGRTETMQSLLVSSAPLGSSGPSLSNLQHKRGASPDPRTREERRTGGDHGPATKRARAGTPTRVERERERPWNDGPAGRQRRFSPPPGGPPPATWERDEGRGRDAGPGGGGGPRMRERDDEKPRMVSIPPVISWFVGELPTAASFDGPVFRTDDLMSLFRNAVIPSSNSRPKSPPLPPPRSGGGRPPPDYGPYQGPNSGRGGRRY